MCLAYNESKEKALLDICVDLNRVRFVSTNIRFQHFHLTEPNFKKIKRANHGSFLMRSRLKSYCHLVKFVR